MKPSRHEEDIFNSLPMEIATGQLGLRIEPLQLIRAPRQFSCTLLAHGQKLLGVGSHMR